MFYRYTAGGRRKTADLDGLFGGSLFLCGGHPSLDHEPRELLSAPGIATMAMNNAALLVRPTLWIGADRPECYSPAILRDAAVLKFARLLYADSSCAPDDRPWRELPATFFYGVTDDYFTPATLLDEHPLLAWWKNVFILSLQLAYRLGFREIFLVGVGFTIPPERPYAVDLGLDADEIDYSRRTYQSAERQFRNALPHFAGRGLRVISCTAGSALNDVLPFVPLRDAVASALASFPERSARGIVHASSFAGETGKRAPARAGQG